MDHSKLHWELDGYPHHDDQQCQKELIERRDWDMLVVLDACRWDALAAVSEMHVEKARTPTESSTAGWMYSVWSQKDIWDDVTYITANPMTDWVQEEMYEGACDVEGNVARYIRAFDMFYDNILGTVRPDDLTDHVIQTNYSPPLVVHYMQPHHPYIGNLKVGLKATDSLKGWLPDTGKISNLNTLPETGHISKKVMRRAYLENVLLVWKQVARLQQRFDTVVYTADHGEVLGPENYDHGGANDPRGRVVPWLEIHND